jgi:hypothetical protein
VKKKYLSPVRMRRCYHEFCNNKTEQLYGFVVNVFLPKRNYFCRTICGRARTYLAMSIDSLGFEGYYKQLYPALGMTMSSATERYFQQHNRKRILDRNYANRPERKTERAKRKLEEISRTRLRDTRTGQEWQLRPWKESKRVRTKELKKAQLHFVRHAGIMDISVEQAKNVHKIRVTKTAKVHMLKDCGK